MPANYNAMSRKELLRERARYPLAQRRIAEIDARLAQLDSEADAAAEQHTRDCEPIQARLREIEDAQIASIGSQQPLDEMLEQKRKNLLFELEQANLRLSTIVDELKRRRKIVEAERAEAYADVPMVNLIETTLFRMGDADKQARYAALTAAAQEINNVFLYGIRKRADDLYGYLSTARERKDHDAVAAYTKQLTRANLILKATGNGVATLEAEAQQIYAELTGTN